MIKIKYGESQGEYPYMATVEGINNPITVEGHSLKKCLIKALERIVSEKEFQIERI